jgi:ABC-type antimicrobial peptide transport system permease subunit
MTLLVSVLAGFYPALVLSGFKPIQSLNNKLTNSGSNGGLTLRRGLIVFQFFITQLLIIGTLVVFKQLEYSRSQPLGFAKEAVITLQVPNDEPFKAQALRSQLIQIPEIQNVSLGLFSPSSQSNWEGGYNFAGSGSPSDFPVVMRPADHAYLQTFDMKLLAGRNILETDSLFTHVLVNQALLRQMGIQDPQEAVGKSISVFDDETTIVGVVEDFHTHSLREQIKPTLLFNDPGNVRLAALKMDTKDVPTTLTQVEQIFKEQYPESIFEYAYLDETIASFYKEEEKLSQLFMVFSGLAIFIGCLGLYGLISFMTVQRTKEMGVRKVLGASVHQIVFLFTKEFFVLIPVAFALAAPLGWYLMKGWLEGFVYRIPWKPDMFFIAVGSTLLIAFLTVGYRSVHAAMVNPVDTLRSE